MMTLSGSRWTASAANSSGLLPHSSPKWYSAPGVEDFLHDLAQLVDLDREHAAVRLLVAGLRDGAGERLADRLHAVAQQVLEADDQREAEALFARLLHDGHHVDGRALVLQAA